MMKKHNQNYHSKNTESLGKIPNKIIWTHESTSTQYKMKLFFSKNTNKTLNKQNISAEFQTKLFSNSAAKKHDNQEKGEETLSK